MKKIIVKKCKYCGTLENLRTNKNGVVYNSCVKCYMEIEVPKNIEKANTKIIEKYGVKDLGELRQKRLLENPPQPKPKEIKKCRYCGRLDNLVKSYGEKRKFEYDICQDHWNLYQKEKDRIRKKSNLERFGFERLMLNKELKNKMMNTIRGRTYEDKKKITEKKEKTNRERYGVANPISLDFFKEKRDKTCLDKYGVKNPMHLPLFKEKALSSYKNTYWGILLEKLKSKKIEPNFTKEFYTKHTGEFEYKCFKCNKIFLSNGTEPQGIWCECNARRSYYEDEIIDWLRPFAKTEIKNNFKFYERGRIRYTIDVYLPEYKFGIDFNGLYHHSYLSIGKEYHTNKALYFKEKGIDFIQVFENEWLSKREIINSIIKRRLNLNLIVRAESCDIKEISNEQYLDFLRNNHIQEFSSAKIKIGLFYKNELISLCSFSQSRFNRENSWQLIRFCDKNNIIIINGFKTILSYFEEKYHPNKLISYVSLRFLDWKNFLENEFIGDSITKPDYFYYKTVDPSTVFNRMTFEKDKLSKKLNKFDPNLTEIENLYNNGYLRIFDAGNLKMAKNY